MATALAETTRSPGRSPPATLWCWRASRAPSARCARSRTSRSRSRPASAAPCSAPTAPARRRCSTSSPAISRRPPGTVRFFGEDVTRLPPYERIRMGHAPHLPDLAAVPRPDRPRQSLPGRARRRARPLQLPAARATTPSLARGDRELLRRACASTHIADQLVSNLAHGQQRQLEIGMALAGAPRLILFDEPAAGLSPAERRELVGAPRLAARPYRLRPHRARPRRGAARRRARDGHAQRPRASSTARPAEIENDAEVQAHLSGREARHEHAARPPARCWSSTTCTSITASPTRCRASASASTAACSASSAATAWARRRSATRSWGWCRPRAAASSSRARSCSASRPTRSSQRGVGYVPQGRRVWPSLSVDEHLRLVVAAATRAPWTVERIYETFPRLAERRRNGGAQLSGGEQQMLAISRALLANPRLLVMDEPTEGLAPVIVEQVEAMLRRLADEGEISVLLVEQNLGVAMDVAERVAIMVNGRIARENARGELAADRDLQQRLLGVRRLGRRRSRRTRARRRRPRSRRASSVSCEQRRRGGAGARCGSARRRRRASRPRRAPTLWSATAGRGRPRGRRPGRRLRRKAESAPVPVAAAAGRTAYVAGTFDTKGARAAVHRATASSGSACARSTVDLVDQRQAVARRYRPGRGGAPSSQGASAPCSRDDRGAAVTAMAEAFERFIAARRDVGGIISAGGSGGTALATPAMRRLPVGVPQGDGLDRRLRRREALCRPVRHLHDVLGHRRVRASTASPSRCCRTRRTRWPA